MCKASGGQYVGRDAALGLSMLQRYSAPLAQITQIPRGGHGSCFYRAQVNDNVCGILGGAVTTFFASGQGRSCQGRLRAAGCFLVGATVTALACDLDLGF